jgi:hypothetical protein
MKNFNWIEFTLKVPIKAKLSTLYDAWTKSDELEKWFLSKAVYLDSENNPIDKNANVKKGSTYRWNWYTFDVTESEKIFEANGKVFFQFGFVGCTVDIKLIEQGDSVIVELRQYNIPIDDESKKGIRLSCDTGWSFFLVNLKSIYEGGIDLRNKHAEFKGMVNN